MRTLSANLIQAKNMLGGDQPWIILIVLALTGGTTFRLASNNEDITFQGELFTAFPLQIELPKESSKGEIPTVKLGLANATRAIQVHLEAQNGGVGSTVQLIIVNAGLLAENYAELTMDFDVLSSDCTAQWISVTLGSPNPLRSRFPLHRFIAMHCNWQFKSVECGYAGADMVCERSLAACRAKNNSKRFGGFPGLQPGGLRLA